MEGREIAKVEQLKKSLKNSQKEAKELADVGAQDGIELEDPNSEEMAQGVFSLAGKWRDNEDADTDPDADDIEFDAEDQEGELE